MAVDVDDDTLQACVALWKTETANLPKLFPGGLQAGKLKSPQAAAYAVVSSEKGKEAQRYSGGVRVDYRKVAIKLYGTKAVVSKGLGFVLSLFSAQLGAPGKPTLAYPSTDASGLPRFLCWYPLNDGALTQDPNVKAGNDVWVATVEGEVRSSRVD